MNAAVVNTLLGGSAGGLAALCIAYWKNNRLWSFQAMLNGALTGKFWCIKLFLKSNRLALKQKSYNFLLIVNFE